MTESKSHSASATESKSAPTRSPAQPRILLVDDDAVNQMVAQGLIRRKGWKPTGVQDGKAAVAAIEKESFDVVLLDLQMPEMDGFETAKAIREIEAGKGGGWRVPIIALTTMSLPETREKCMASGMDDYLTKPIQPPELYAAIERKLGAGT